MTSGSDWRASWLVAALAGFGAGAGGLLGLLGSPGCTPPPGVRTGGGYTAAGDPTDDNAQCLQRAQEILIDAGDPVVLPEPPVGQPVEQSAEQPGSGAGASLEPGDPPAPGDASDVEYEVTLSSPTTNLRVRVLGATFRTTSEGMSSRGGARFGELVTATNRSRATTGFIYGIDLRPYRSVVFVVDATTDMCTPTGARPVGRAAPRVLMDDVGDHLIAAIAGLPATSELSLIATGSGVRHFQPGPSEDGRRAAMFWACSLRCSHQSSLGVALLRAFAENPEVVVVVSQAGTSSDVEQREASTHDLDVQLTHVDPERLVERAAYAPPVIAIAVGGESEHLHAIATQTGGLYVVRR